jgi:hypothetical protein
LNEIDKIVYDALREQKSSFNVSAEVGKWAGIVYLLNYKN